MDRFQRRKKRNSCRHSHGDPDGTDERDVGEPHRLPDPVHRVQQLGPPAPVASRAHVCVLGACSFAGDCCNILSADFELLSMREHEGWDGAPEVRATRRVAGWCRLLPVRGILEVWGEYLSALRTGSPPPPDL
jgi:hypothetical protein